ncbi:MAG: cytochrome c3 family protein [Acidobacteriaceae bacterium]
MRIYELPSFVSFSHKTHLAHGVTCQQCHGQVADQVQVYKAMDISMATCIACHRAKQASTDCDTCHMLEQ